jgi:hypothetical protein
MPFSLALPGGAVFALATGIAFVRRRSGGEGITVVAGSLAYAPSRDLAAGLRLAARPGQELPVLAVLLDRDGQGEPERSRDLAARCGVAYAQLDGTDIESSWNVASEAIAYVRRARRPALLVARSGSPGVRTGPGSAATVAETATRVATAYGDLLEAEALLSTSERGRVWERWHAYLEPCQEIVRVAVDGSRTAG